MGLKVRNRGPQLSHLRFADDSSVFMEATLANYTVLKEIRQRFGRASGESINFNKSEITFYPNTPGEIKEDILGGMGRVMADEAKYLGLPTNWGRSKKQALSFLFGIEYFPKSKGGLCRVNIWADRWVHTQ